MNMKLLRYVSVAFVVSLMGLGSESVGQAPGCTVTLSPGSSIQEAIDRAASGDVICLQAGKWKENVSIEKELTLRAAEVKPEPNAVISSAKEGWPVILIRSDKPIEVTVIGLKITGAFRGCYQMEPEWVCANGISVHGLAKAVIQQNTISGNEYDGIVMLDSSQVAIKNTTISNNGYGIGMTGSSQVTIESTIISNNGDGVRIWGSSQATIKNTTIVSNKGNGIVMWESSQATIEGSTISNNGYGIGMAGSSQATIRNNKIVNNGSYGVVCYQRPCFNTDWEFEGAVRGSGNEISKPDVCPGDLQFLMTSAGGCYGPKC